MYIQQMLSGSNSRQSRSSSVFMGHFARIWQYAIPHRPAASANRWSSREGFETISIL